MSRYSQFFRQYRAIPGIYKITNKITGEFYVGATSNVGRRFCQHLGSYDLQIQKDIKDLGPENFTFEILEVTATDLAGRETYWIDTLKPAYNKGKGGQGGLSEISRLRKRAAQKKLHQDPEYKEKQKKGMTKSDYLFPDGTVRSLRPQDAGKFLKRINIVKIN